MHERFAAADAALSKSGTTTLEAAIAGGFQIVEVTLTTPDAFDHIAALAERKDVLSTLFWLLTTLAYFRYTDRPTARRFIRHISRHNSGRLEAILVKSLNPPAQ